MDKVYELTRAYRMLGWLTPQVTYPPPYPHALATGLGVYVCIVDTGCDYKHQDFKPESGGNRVKWFWDMTMLGNPPAGFTYGTEWNNAQIVAETVTSNDSDGRGTHLTGVAAGSGRATGNNQLPYRYPGMAPEADIIIVKVATLAWTRNQVLDSRIIDAVTYAFGKADQEGKPCVVIIPTGHFRGGHDGTVSLDTTLSSKTGPGKLIVCAAGNDVSTQGAPYPDLAQHATFTIGSVGGTHATTFNVPTFSPTPTINEYFEIEGWHNLTAGFKARLTGPNGGTTGWINPGSDSGAIATADGTLRIKNALPADTTNKGKRIYFFANDAGDNVPPTQGNWTLDFERAAGTTTGRIDLWATAWVFGSQALPVAFTTDVSDSMEICSPASGDDIICSGVYASKLQWTNRDNQQSLYPENPSTPPPNTQALYAKCRFSAPGPRRDIAEVPGAYRPDVIVPGHGIMSTLSSITAPSNTWKDQDGVHRMSFSYKAEQGAAVLGGGAALHLQNNPDSLPLEFRAAIRAAAFSDSFTGAVPNGDWGYGKYSCIPLIPLPLLVKTLVSAALQKFHFAAPAGFSIDMTTVIAGDASNIGTVNCTAPDGFAITNLTSSGFDVATQEHGPSGPFSYSVNGVRATNGQFFAATGLEFSIDGADQIDQWA